MSVRINTEKRNLTKGMVCCVDGCERGQYHKLSKTCSAHHTRMVRNGNYSLKLTKISPIEEHESYASIILYGGKECLISKKDIGLVSGKKWSFSKKNGVIHQKWKNNKNSHIKIHRLIFNFPKGKVIDHINGDILDNRRENLRVLDHWENIINQKSRPMRNIEKSGNGFCVRMSRNNKRYYCGRYSNIEDAIEARDRYANEIHRELRKR